MSTLLTKRLHVAKTIITKKQGLSTLSVHLQGLEPVLFSSFLKDQEVQAGDRYMISIHMYIIYVHVIYTRHISIYIYVQICVMYIYTISEYYTL